MHISTLKNLIVPGCLALAASGAPADAQSTLWITDDVTKDVYEITSTGLLLSSFDNPPGGNSEIAIDESDDTLWITAEGGTTVPGTIFQVDKLGSILTSFSATVYGGFTPEGVTVDPSNGTLWTVDDNDVIPILRIFNVDKTGNLLGSFPTSSYDPLSVSPQGIALDPESNTLWITDNSTSRIYNVSKGGALISSFSTMTFAPGFINPQGISVSPDDTLWVTARTTGTIYNITTNGTLLSSFASSIFDPLSLNPTGVAVALDPGPPFVDFGAAKQFAVLALSKGKIKLKDGNSKVQGDVGLSANGKQDFKKGLIDGAFIVDPSADNSNSNQVVITGGTLTQSLAQANADALAASDEARDLPATQWFGKIKQTTTIFGQSGLNVVAIEGVDLKKGDDLMLFGPADASFVLNIDKKFKLKDGSDLELAGGVLADFVLINGQKDVEVSKGSVSRGTVLVPQGKAKFKEGAVHFGRVIAGKEIEIAKGSQILQ